MNDDAYEKKLNEEVNIPSIKKEIDRHDSKSYWPIITIKDIQWFTFLNIMNHTEDNMNTSIKILP